MRKSSFELTIRNFYNYMEMDIDLLMKIEESRKVVKSLCDKREIFEAYVFKICANWEILVEDLLIDCFNKDTTRYSEFTGFKISKDISIDTCKAIIYGTGYFDFKNISDLRKKAKNYLAQRLNPFKEIPTSNAAKIDEFFKIRNYLAHYSFVAKRSLEEIYKSNYNLRTFRQPGEFLLTKHRREKIPRMGVYINNFMDTAEIMANFLKVKIS